MISSLLHALRAFLSGDGALILPELELLLFALGILIIDRWLAAGEKQWNVFVALAGAAFSGFTLYVQHQRMQAERLANPESPGLLGFHQGMLVDPFFLYFAPLFLAVTVLLLLLSVRSPEMNVEKYGSFCALLLAACAGMMLMASGMSVIVIFVGMQLMALSAYRLIRSAKQLANVQIAARSFAALWACSSVLLAVGFLMLYGDFRTTNIGRIGAILDTRLDNNVPFAGLTTWHAVLTLACLAAGAFFLSEAVPFHWFAPDSYEFSTASSAAFLAAGLKTAGLALLLRLFAFLFLFAHEKWIYLWSGVAIVSLIWGGIAAIRQRRILRLLAYGSVAHAGFIILGLVAANQTAFTGMVYYIGTNLFCTIGACGVLLALQGGGERPLVLSDLNGLFQRSPALAWLLLLFLLALAGIPLTSGFVAKYYLVKALIASQPGLAAFAVVNTLLAAFYYGRVAVYVFKKPALEPNAAVETAPITVSSGQTVAFTIAAFVSLAAGLYPAPFLRLASYVFGP